MMLSDFGRYMHFSGRSWSPRSYNIDVVVHWLTLDDLSKYLKTPKSTLYKLSRKGIISGHKLGKRLLFDRDEVDRQVKLHKKGPQKEEARGVRRTQAS
jgi:excisionase family DNA binding protein